MASRPAPDLLPPSLALLALELRAPWEFGSILPAWPVLQRAPVGDGHCAIVFPGLVAGDGTTIPLRRYLSWLGYRMHGWTQGLNYGPREGVIDGAKKQLDDLYRSCGRKVSLIGWSLGGIYARELAKLAPGQVRCVITLGSPFAGPPKSTNAWRVYQWASGIDPHQAVNDFKLAEAPPVPTTSIYSRSDGIVAWQGSIQQPTAANPDTENVEVFASHIGLGVNPTAWWAVADRLAQPEGQWRPFDRTGAGGLKAMLYPDPAR